MNYAALRAALLALGIEIPLDPTDPRITYEKLAEYHSMLGDKYTELRAGGERDLGMLRSFREGQKAMRAEWDTREAAEVEARTLDADLEALDNEGQPVVVDAPKGSEDATVVIGLGVTVAPETPEAVAAGVEDVALARVASLQTPEQRSGSEGGARTTPVVSWRTAAAMGAFASGAAMPSVANIGPTLMDTAAAVAQATREDRHVGDSQSKVVLASLPSVEASGIMDVDGILMRGHGPDQNTAIIEARLADHGARVAAAAAVARGETPPAPRTAAAPWCEPYDIIRALPECVDASTPFRNSLPFIPMGHGGFQFNTGISLSGVAGAVDIWTPEDQAAIDPTDPDTWKRCIPIVCPGDPPTITLDDWITACLEWQVGTDLNNPERFRQYFTKLEALRARVTEQYLMSLIDELTINYDNSPLAFLQFGGLNDLIRMVMSIFQSSDYDERTVQESGYTMYLDTAQIDVLVAGELLSSSAKTNGTRGGVISHLLSALPMIQRVEVIRDRVPGAYGSVGANGNPRAANPAVGQASADVPAFAVAGIIRIVPTAEVFAFGTGELRTGVRQDFSYARQNKVGWFAEEAIALTKYGCRPWFKINATLCSISKYTGDILWNVAGYTDPFTCTFVADNTDPDEPDPFPFEGS